MSQAIYLRYELLRALRNRRFFIFSLGFPLLFYLVIATPNRNEDNFLGSGIPAPLYYMVGLVAFGAMVAMLSAGARIANERAAGWNRLLRLTPLSPFAYLRAKIVTAYALAGLSMLLLYIAGFALGVRLPATQWLEMTGLILLALVPFGALGILFGHLLNPDSIGPFVGGGASLFAFLGGVWFPITSGVLHDIGVCLPSYWLVQASHISTGGSAWGLGGWLTVVAWSVVASLAAVRAYRRDAGP